MNAIAQDPGPRYPRGMWKKFRHLFSPETVALLKQTEKNGYRVVLLDGNVRNHRRVICPPGCQQPYTVGFRDFSGRWTHEFTLALHPNGLSINYATDELKTRPAYPAFTVDEGANSYHASVSSLYPSITGKSLKTDAAKWLTHRDLIVFLYSAADGLVQGEFVAPFEMAHALQQFAMIHRVPTYGAMEKMQTTPNTTFWVAPGLRLGLFDGKQNVTFFPELSGKMTIIGNSVYDGMMAKKPCFNDIAWKCAVFGGIATHASMATPSSPIGHLAGLLEEYFEQLAAFATICDSGRGKTELRMWLEHFLGKDNRLLLGFRRNGGNGARRLSMPVPKGLTLQWNCHGDDGLFVKRLRRSNDGRIRFRNWEDAFFDRNSGAYGPGDLEEIDRMQKLSRGWWELRMTNIRANPSDKLEHWRRDLMGNGDPCPNPRVTYSTALLRRAGIKYEKARLPLGNVLYTYARVDNVTCAPPWCKLPSWLAPIVEILGGPDSVKSKSVTAAVPADKVVQPSSQKRTKFAHIGTMAQFSPVAFKTQAGRVVQRHAMSPRTAHYLVTQESRPSESVLGRALERCEKEVEYAPGCLLRDLLVMEVIGKASITWAPSDFPFLGYVAQAATWGDVRVPKAFLHYFAGHEDEELACAQEYYTQMCNELDALEKRGIDAATKSLFDFFRSIYGDSRAVRRMKPAESRKVIQKGEELMRALAA